MVVNHFSYPSIVEVSIFPSQIQSIYVEKDDVVIHADIFSGGNSQDRRFRLSEIYKKKENAEKKLVELLEARIKGLQAEIDAIPKNDQTN